MIALCYLPTPLHINNRFPFPQFPSHYHLYNHLMISWKSHNKSKDTFRQKAVKSSETFSTLIIINPPFIVCLHICISHSITQFVLRTENSRLSCFYLFFGGKFGNSSVAEGNKNFYSHFFVRRWMLNLYLILYSFLHLFNAVFVVAFFHFSLIHSVGRRKLLFSSLSTRVIHLSDDKVKITMRRKKSLK